MTASLNLVVDQRDAVLTVPNRAVRTVNKQKLVTVLIDGQQVQKPVQTGLSNDTLTEIVSGLQEGDVVVLNATTTTTTNNGAAAPMGVPGIGGPPPGM